MMRYVFYAPSTIVYLVYTVHDNDARSMNELPRALRRGSLYTCTCTYDVQYTTRCFPHFPTAARSETSLWLRRHAVGDERRAVCFRCGRLGGPTGRACYWLVLLLACACLPLLSSETSSFKQAAIRSALAFITVQSSHR